VHALQVGRLQEEFAAGPGERITPQIAAESASV